MHNIYLFIFSFIVYFPRLGCQPLRARNWSICIPGAQNRALEWHLLKEWANPHCPLRPAAQAPVQPRGLCFDLPPRASVTHLCLRNLPLKPSVPSPLLRPLSPEKLYLAWGRAVWLWLITYSSKSIIYASTVCPESFRPAASYAQKSGFETQKAFFALKTIVSTVSFQKPIL